MGAAREAPAGCAGVRRQRPSAEIRASSTHLWAPRPQTCRGRAQGAWARPDAPDPGPRLCGSPARAAAPAAKPPMPLSQLSVSRSEARCRSPGPRPPAAACGDPGPGRSTGVAPPRPPSAATQPARWEGGSPVCAAELHARGAGPSGLQAPRAEVGWSRWAISLCAAGAAPPVTAAPRPRSGTSRSLVPALTCTHLSGSFQSGRPGAAAARRSWPQVPRSAAR